MGELSGGNELNYFEELWATRKSGPVSHSADIWDERAKEWIDDLEPGDGKSIVRAKGMLDRVAATADYLRSHGLLGKEDSVVDVGCGPGLFVLEFAKTARQSVGIDYSERFVEYGNEQAAKRGLSNARFEQRDFFGLDVDKEGLAGAYDLVFTSITPAATGEGCLDKLIKMSRGWCYNASFVYAGDTLSERVAVDVFGEPFRPRWDGRGFYALMNLVWLRGYYPHTWFFSDVRDEVIVPSRKWARKCVSYCGKHGEENVDKVLRYLEKLGETERRSEFKYGSILWDTRKRDRR